MRTAINGRLVRLRLGRFNRGFNVFQIVAVANPLRMPVVRFEALQHIVVVAQLCWTIERNQIVVVQHDQLAQRQRSGQRACLVRNAFHQIAVAAQHVRVVIHNLIAGLVVDGAKMLLRDRHSHSHRQSLPQRTRRHFHAIRVAVFGMPRRARVPLPESLQIFDRYLVAGKKKRAIQQRRGVPIRQHKPVAVRPFRIRRIVLHDLVKQQIGNGGAAQRRAGMTAIRLLHLIDGEQTQGINR